MAHMKRTIMNKANTLKSFCTIQCLVVLSLLVVITTFSVLNTTPQETPNIEDEPDPIIIRRSSKERGIRDAASKHSNMIPANLDEMIKSNVEQDDPALINIIRKDFLYPPSSDPYNLASNKDDPSQGQPKAISELLLSMKKTGFFVEAGGLDGETRSNTLYFEKTLNWKGILVEADPKNFEQMKTKNRKAWLVPAGLSPKPHPVKVLFHQHFNIGQIVDESENVTNKTDTVEITCFPLYSILSAMNATTKVDYLSLDVEGFELDVLKTIPWDKVNITTISVEFEHVRQGKEALLSYMLHVGYKLYKIHFNGVIYNDYILYHPKLLSKY